MVKEISTAAFLCLLPAVSHLAAETPIQSGPRRVVIAAPAAGRFEILRQEDPQARHELGTPMKLLLGALVPGLPQLLEGKPRAWAYFAAEGASIAGFVSRNISGNNFRARYKLLARSARNNYVYPGFRNNTTETVDILLPGYGEYYEDLLKWPSSGDYDDDPSQAELQPEADPRTYNGHQWEIAKINNYTQTNGGLPVPAGEAEVQAALQAYNRQVYPVAYGWDWTGLDREKVDYRRLFDKSESAFRRRSTFATILVANHLVSVLDVLVSEKLNRADFMAGRGLQVHLELDRPDAPTGMARPTLSVSRQF
ncbi:MAG: hypothetical protein V1794_05160 [Candidatus Glassbacteria bacterium]